MRVGHYYFLARFPLFGILFKVKESPSFLASRMRERERRAKVGGYVSHRAIGAPMDPFPEIQNSGEIDLYLRGSAPVDAATTSYHIRYQYFPLERRTIFVSKVAKNEIQLLFAAGRQ